MTPSAIIELLRQRFAKAIVAAFPEDRHPRVHINAADWRDVAVWLRNEPAVELDWLACLSGVDYAADDRMCVVYDLWSFTHRHALAVKVYCPRAMPSIPSVMDLWPAADWHEREAFDMFGIDFPGHRDLRRILCADDWKGHPLCKDYVYPREYHGIPASVELDWQQKPDYPK